MIDPLQAQAEPAVPAPAAVADPAGAPPPRANLLRVHIESIVLKDALKLESEPSWLVSIVDPSGQVRARKAVKFTLKKLKGNLCKVRAQRGKASSLVTFKRERASSRVTFIRERASSLVKPKGGSPPRRLGHQPSVSFLQETVTCTVQFRRIANRAGANGGCRHGYGTTLPPPSPFLPLSPAKRQRVISASTRF